MRAFIVTASALALAACGGQGSTADETSDAGTVTVAQAATTSDAAASAGGPDLSGLPAAYQGANINNGRQQWFLCAACHQLGNGTQHSVGPDLHHIFGDTAATNESFPLYSPALKESGIVWSAETIDTWIANPRAILPTTTMIFAGIPNEKNRIDLIGYLWVESGGDAE